MNENPKNNHLINKDKFADSAGVPWQGRSFSDNNFAADDGSAPQHLIEAIAKFRNSELGPEFVIDAFRTSRLLIPLLAELGESEDGAHGHKVDKSAELAIVTVQTPDEQTGMPVFSSVQAMKNWNATARPVPADAVRVALAAAADGNTRIILDAENETEFVIRRPAIEAIAKQQPWIPPHRNEAIREVFKVALAPLPLISGFTLEAGDPNFRLEGAEVILNLTLEAGLDNSAIDDLMQKLAEQLAETEDSALIAEHVDSLRVKLTSAL